MKIAFKRRKKHIINMGCRCKCVNSFATFSGMKIVH